MRPFLKSCLLLVLAAARPALAQAPLATWDDVSGIFASRCVMCHAGDAAPLGLRLDRYDAALAGGTNGPVLIAGDPDGSELWRRIQGTSLPRMPMTGPPYLSPEEMARIEAWIRGGLQAAPVGSSPAAPAPAPALPKPGETVTYQHVAPIFAQRCAKCHTENGLLGPPPEGYRLDSYAATLDAVDRLRIVPFQPEASELMRRVLGQARPRMPLDGPPYLEDAELALIEAWIAQGARDAAGQSATVRPGTRVRLHGTLRPGWQLDGLDLEMRRNTRVDKSPRPGDYVEVRGVLNPQGAVVVERIRRR